MENELDRMFLHSKEVPKIDDEFIKYFNNFREYMMMYNCAIKEVRTKFEVLNADFSVTYKRNPIEMIKSRVKSPQSIFEKLQRKNLELSMDSILDNISDVAGVRVICSFIDDIYEVAEMLVSQDDVKLLQIKDYIKNPKTNGYRSYHMIIEVPVFFARKKQNIKVEVQLRTIAMDFWASLEHSMKYKQDIIDTDYVVDELKKCADIIASTDLKMQEINNAINKEKEIV
ncbi:MAG: GTP pyrophosphokinase family protein [Clostridia bacterium]|nr:GTP pyrophosphokinase family protein [Clostridia bacterium]